MINQGQSTADQPPGVSAHRVVIVGGGFAGLYAAKRLGNAPLSLTVIDRRNFHLFQPLLYQVATGSLSPGEIAAPLRGAFSAAKKIRESCLERQPTSIPTQRASFCAMALCFRTTR